MGRSRGLSLAGAVLLAAWVAGCGGGEADHEDEHEGREVAGPTTVMPAAPTPAAPAPADPTPAPAASPVAAPTPTPTPAPAGGAPAAATVAWEPDIRPILAADCVRCHDYLASYAGAMSAVTPGNPNSALVTVTRQGGSMYSHLSGDRAAKSALIRAWVVDNAAAPSR